jgi:putative flippase GtrA
MRFGCVGFAGLATDLGIFSIIHEAGVAPLLARLGSMACATVVTWRLNRAFTFGKSGRRAEGEAARYAAVTVAAQSISYGLFAALVLFMPRLAPQLALLAGAASAAFFSFEGHRLFSFAPPTPTNGS